MKTVPWLMACALLLWGWQTGMMVYGVVLAAMLEGSRWVRTRWDLTDSDLNRVYDLGVALFACVALLLYSTEDRLVFVFRLVEWLPVCLFPIMLAQAYGNRAEMPLSVFWWLLRRSSSPLARRSLNISYLYFGVCILATSASTHSNEYFYPGIALIVILGLASRRPRRVSLMVWILLIDLAAVAGVGSHQGLRVVQDSVERALGGWLANFFGSPVETRECQTKIGRPGQIPQSVKIILRLEAEPGGYVPPLLRESTWDVYNRQTWSASNSDFMMARAGSGERIRLLPTNSLSSAIRIARYYEDGRGTLDLPHGTFEIDDLQANVRTNRLGVMMMDDGPGLVDFRAQFCPAHTIDGAPIDRDKWVPPTEQPALRKVLADLKLDGMTDRQKVRAIDRYFHDPSFTYSLNPIRARKLPEGMGTWLGYFLLKSHKGHCEYYATATVLLLRQAGIPARYVTGYLVRENERHGSTYVVRGRDEHAWALVYHKDTGLWDQLDTTPGGDADSLHAALPWWQPAADALSDLYFQFSKWRWSKTSYARYTTWLLVPLILYLIGRIVLDQRRRGTGASTEPVIMTNWPGLDSELFLINQHLAAAHLARLPNESLRSWERRLEHNFPKSDRLHRIFRLHRRLRFDPRGLRHSDRETLRAEAQQWLAEFDAQHHHPKTAVASS